MVETDPRDVASLIPARRPLSAGGAAALEAMDTAIMDWVGQHDGKPLYRLYGADPQMMPPTSMSIAIDMPERVREQALEASKPEDMAWLKERSPMPLIAD